MVSKGHTLWLMPKGKIYDKFSDLIEKLAKENSAPVFQPHITLLGEIMLPEGEVILRTEQLVSGQKPFTITLQNIDYQEYHFKALFVKADVTKPLVNLHERAKELFGMQHIPPYMPHLSLLYGNYPPQLKEEIISTIDRERPAQFDINSVHLVKGGKVEDWRIIKEIPFR